MAKALLYYGAQSDQRTGAFIETEAAASLSLTKDLNEGITSMFSRRAPKFKASNPSQASKLKVRQTGFKRR